MIQLPRYSLTTKLHESSSTLFYRGHRNEDRARVAVKCLKNEYPSQSDLARLRHEHNILSSLDLPGVVKAIALERYGNGLALVTEDIGGQSLDLVIKGQKLPLQRVLEIGISVADTLSGLHRNQVIHKDVKPQNILLNVETSQVALIDFGIATRLAQETQHAARLDALEGTLAYMSPEQTGRMNRVIDHRSDLYSLGVTLYELLTGTVPFQSTDPTELVHSHIARRPTPPHEVDAKIPRAVSDVVMKLLAKTAEDRYQNAHGVRADLQECLSRLREGKLNDPFPLALQDSADQLRTPQKLYGRDAEVETLMASFSRVSDGAAELLLVAGYAGIGKSVLVHEVHKAIAKKRGAFIAGKFDQLNRSVPFAPVAHAFRDLIRQLLAEPPVTLARWRQELTAALGNSGQVLIDMLPELELIIGKQPAVQPLGATESQNRFAFVFQNFLRVFTKADHPLVLFLDDLQWADPGSLKLLHLLLTDPESGNLLVIGAYRDNEVGADHLLTLALEGLRKEKATVNNIFLKPLESAHVVQLVADALGTSTSTAEPLGQFVFDRSHGNPLFATQLLTALHHDKLLSYDKHSNQWRWDLAQMAEAKVANNVVDLLAQKIRRVPAATQGLLILASCIGHRFDLRTLAAINNRPPAETARDLWEALREGLVVPLDSSYRFLHLARAEEAEGPLADPSFNVSYRFQHDRAQQAAYSLVEERQARHIHLRLGRLMLAAAGQRPRDEQLFDILNHLNLGSELITEPGERLELARLNLSAGRRAKTATAYEAAASYLEAGMALVDESSWTSQYDLSFELYFERVECEALARRAETADRLFEKLLSKARSRLDQARVQNMRINLYTTLGDIPGAMRVGTQALALFGIEMPVSEDARGAALGAELAAVEKNLAGRSVESLIDSPMLSDPEQQAIQALVTSLFPATFLTSPLLYGSMIVRQVNLSLKYGQSPASPLGYVSYGYLLSGVMGRHLEALSFGDLAIRLNEKFNNPEMKTKIYFLYGTFAHFLKPTSEVLAVFDQARQYGLESGDFQYFSYTTYLTFAVRLGRGEELASVRQQVAQYLGLMQRTKDQLSTLFLQVARQVVANLEGRTTGPLSFTNEDMDEVAFEGMLKSTGLIFVACFHYTYKAQIAYLRGDYDKALEWASEAEKIIGSAAGLYFTTDLVFYLALTLAARHEKLPESEKAANLARLATQEATLATWAKHSPATFEHKRLLVAAEAARIHGREVEMLALYDRAIEGARKNDFVSDEALANELCARFHAAGGREKVARTYLRDAYYGYLRWGLTTKVAAMESEHPHLRAQAQGRDGGSGAILSGGATTTRTWTAGLLDAASVVQATQAISGEIVLDRVVERMMRIVIGSAGAQRAVLLLERGGGLSVEATIQVDPDVVRQGLAIPLREAKDLPISLVQHVARTHDSVVLGSATRDIRFGRDSYVAQRRPKSVSCLPMMRQRKLTGVLYLENNDAEDAFTPERSELLQVLSTQAAIAIENALLYADVQAATQKLRQANETLEQQVAQRTEELRKANSELWSEMDLAHKIQTVLLPQQPAIPGYEVAATMKPADTVGGDYFDVFSAGGRHWVMIGDVSGHGVPAGLIMMMIQTAVRATVGAQGANAAKLAPSQMLALVNSAIRTNLERIGKGQYMTVTAMSLEGGDIRYAGLHEDILIYRAAAKRVERVETRGIWLGIADDIQTLLEDASLRIEPGDVVLLSTDGLVEASRGDDMLGRERLLTRFQELALRGDSCQAILDGLFQELSGWTVKDDVTLVAFRRTRGA